MYTEDDEKVKVKGKNSNGDYNDFYTSFNKLNKKDTKESVKNDDKKKVKKEEKVVPKTEEDYSDFYGLDNDEETEVVEPTNVTFDNNNGNKNTIKMVIAIVLLIVLGILIWFLLNNKTRGDIEISNNNITLKPGDSEYISYRVVGTDKQVTSTFTSSNTRVATVSENGEIKAVGNGEAVITIHYTIDGKTREKSFAVKVNGPELKHELTLTLVATATNWINKDVVITVNTKTDSEITSLKYAINCTGNCNYKDVSNNKITVTDNGVSKVKVIAKDRNNNEATKEIEVRVDKEVPTVTYTGDKDVISNDNVEVCVTCNDKVSGCKQNKVCKTYTVSNTNQTITVSDNAGNTTKSPTFNVTINRPKLSCTLKVASDGTVSATLNGSAKYYGFNSDYSGSNELSRKINIGVSKKGDRGAKVIHYFLKDKNGYVGTCHITVIKECSADNVCTFRAS